MDSSAPAAEHRARRQARDRLLARWLFLPIVLPGIALAVLAWRSVATEQAQLQASLEKSYQRLAAQIGATMGILAREEMNRARARLVAWAGGPSDEALSRRPLDAIFDQVIAVGEGTAAGPARPVGLPDDVAGFLAASQALPDTGLHAAHGRIFLVATGEPLPRGRRVLARIDERVLMDRIAGAMAAREPGSQTDPIRYGIRLSDSSLRFLHGSPSDTPPLAVAPVLGGIPAWQVGVWPVGDSPLRAGRTRMAWLAAVLALSLAMLVAGAVAALRALATQRRLLAMQTDFVSNISHELKTPLTSISMYAELLEKRKAPQRAAEFGAIIRSEANRLRILIETVLAFSRQESGQGPALSEDIDVAELACEICYAMAPIALKRGIRISFAGEPGPAVRLRCDPGSLRSVVQNLVDNAVKYGRENGHVDVSVQHKDRNIEIVVEDDGIGIARSDQRHVFQRFFRGGDPLTRGVSGTGLGLAIAKTSVERSGGTIHLESGEGRGTRVTVLFRRKESSDGREAG